MPSEEVHPSTNVTKSACVAHICPNCGTDHQVSVEQILQGGNIVTRCHCRACGHSWHPVVTRTSDPA